MNLTQTCRSIELVGHAGDRDTVLSALGHAAPRVRVVALGAALRVGALDQANLEAALAYGDSAVRYRALELVHRVPFGPTLADEVISSLADPDTREVAAFVLGELDLADDPRGRAVAALGEQALNDDDPLCRESAVAALGALGGGLPVIPAATTDVATVRRRAVLALAPFEGPEVEQALAGALEDGDWQAGKRPKTCWGSPLRHLH